LIRRNSSRKPFCESLAAGTATLMAVWPDAESKASVTAEIKKPGTYVTITCLGSNYATWLARTRDADVKNKL
jgi:hypothetical protein